MELIRIEGGRALQGQVRIGGAKNAVTKQLVASLLSDKRCTLTNVPSINEVAVTLDLCRELGSEVLWDRAEGVIEIQTKELKTSCVPQRFSGANRIPILLMGALLGRTREEVVIPTSGGCKIGKRPVDFHLAALEALGATIEKSQSELGKIYVARAKEGLQGARIVLPFPSVGATENALLASSRARGTTIIQGVALEPEVIDLILFLQKLGVIISFQGDRTLRVVGVQEMKEVQHAVIPDRIEAASLAMAALATKGDVLVEQADQRTLLPFLAQLQEMNAGFEVKSDGIRFFHKGPLRGGIHLTTDVHPGFLTDWQQPFVALLTQAAGSSVVHETLYENRFGYTDTLNRMGASIQLFSDCLGGSCRFACQGHLHSAVIGGATKLVGQEITIPDLRGGYAYLIAALVAEGTSLLSGVDYIDRGYEDAVAKLASLGAVIERRKEAALV